jgi:K+ transporter
MLRCKITLRWQSLPFGRAARGVACDAQTMQNTETQHKGSMTALSLGALGVVYGDIGTSPLYAFKEAFNPAHNLGYRFRISTACCRSFSGR